MTYTCTCAVYTYILYYTNLCILVDVSLVDTCTTKCILELCDVLIAKCVKSDLSLVINALV